MSNLKKKTNADIDEVEELLRAAQDDMLLKLSLNSHIARAASSSSSAGGIDPDLDRRYQALKKSKATPKQNFKSSNAIEDKIDAVSDDDLFARFAVLKKTIPSYDKNEEKNDIPSDVPENQDVREEGSDDDEVEKVIQWAIDAARLDPSPLSDDDDLCSTSDDDDDDDDGVDSGKKGKKN